MTHIFAPFMVWNSKTSEATVAGYNAFNISCYCEILRRDKTEKSIYTKKLVAKTFTPQMQFSEVSFVSIIQPTVS